MKSRIRRKGGLAAVALALVASVGLTPAISADAAPKALTKQQARDKILGKGWNNPDEIRARSIGNTTWLVSYGGTLVLHDSTVEDQLTDTGKNANTNGFVSLNDIVAAKPDAILQNHTHFDQNHSAVEVASRTGTPLTTDVGGCMFTKVTAVKKGVDPKKVKCNIIREANGKGFFMMDTWAGGLPGIYTGQGIDTGLGNVLGPLLEQSGLGGVIADLTNEAAGEPVDVTDFMAFTAYGAKGWPTKKIPGIDAMAIQVKHSPSFFGRPYADSLSGGIFDPARAAKDIIEDYSSNPQDIAGNIYAQYAPFDLEGSNVGWRVKYKDFSLFHHGSTGPTNGMEPGAKQIRKSLETLGNKQRMDVEVGGVAEMTFITDANYFADNKGYARAIGAKQFFPTHHFNWYPIWLTNPAATYYPGLSETWRDGKRAYGKAFPDLCFTTEKNYATLWSMQASEWKGNKKGSMKPLAGPGCYRG